MEVFVEVCAHAIWVFVVFWSDFVAQLEVKSPVEDDGFEAVGFFIWICNRLVDDHRLYLLSLRHVRVRMWSLTRS